MSISTQVILAFGIFLTVPLLSPGFVDQQVALANRFLAADRSTWLDIGK